MPYHQYTGSICTTGGLRCAQSRQRANFIELLSRKSCLTDLAGSLFYAAQEKYLLSEIICLAALWNWAKVFDWTIIVLSCLSYDSAIMRDVVKPLRSINIWQYTASSIQTSNHSGNMIAMIAYQKNLLCVFLWLPAKLSHKMYAFWLVVWFILLSKNIWLAKFSAKQFYEIGPWSIL